MKKFMAGLIVGLFVGLGVGAVGSVQWLIAMAHSSEQEPPVELNLPEDPIGAGDNLGEFLDASTFEIGFFAKNLKTGKMAERAADRPVCLASIVKVFCLTELYRQKHEASLDLSQKIDVPTHGHISLLKAADLMIGKSDNAATQSLTDFLGRDKVNHIPSLLGIEGMCDNILPDEATLRKTLDKRIFGNRRAAAGLPQHGTARGIANYFELLLNRKIISESASDELIEFFTKHPKPFSNSYAGKYDFSGKGGNLLWTRPPKHYSMMGWSLFVSKKTDEYIVLCVWGEWFPKNMPPDQQSEFLKFVTDSVISILES